MPGCVYVSHHSSLYRNKKKSVHQLFDHDHHAKPTLKLVCLAMKGGQRKIDVYTRDRRGTNTLQPR